LKKLRPFPVETAAFQQPPQQQLQALVISGGTKLNEAWVELVARRQSHQLLLLSATTKHPACHSCGGRSAHEPAVAVGINNA
jgi:hypothetical protein